jgi:hypothetical protein
VARQAAMPTLQRETRSTAVTCLTAWPEPKLSERVSTCTASPGRRAFSALPSRLAQRRRLRASPGRGAGRPAKDRNGDGMPKPDQRAEDAPDGGVGDRVPSHTQERPQLALAPHRVVGAQALHRLDQRRGPVPGPHPSRPTRAQLRCLLPAVERRATDADGLRRLGRAQAVRHGPAPARNHVASSRRCDVWGLRVEKRRRDVARPDRITWPGRPTTCMGFS